MPNDFVIFLEIDFQFNSSQSFHAKNIYYMFTNERSYYNFSRFLSKIVLVFDYGILLIYKGSIIGSKMF